MTSAGDPFDLDGDASAYRRWRDWKLAHAPAGAEALVVEVRDPAQLSDAEREALVLRCRVANLAVYASRPRGEDKDLLRALGAQLGLVRLDANWLADEDGISSLRVSAGGTRGDFIPYTNQPIRWHTDGYYNPPALRIRAMLLHCVERAAEGGENRLLDHEIAYLLLRERDPRFVRALSAPDVMSIPAREADDGVRPAQAGPVFSCLPDSGDLHMRYTARTRSIEWRDDPDTRAAVQALREVIDSAGAHVLRLRLEPGMGIVCNNVLHDRSGFTDGADRHRVVLRARYLDRIAGTQRPA